MRLEMTHLGAQEVLDIAQIFQLTVDHEPIRQPARLRALAAVGAAPAPGLRAEALPAARQHNPQSLNPLLSESPVRASRCVALDISVQRVRLNHS